MKKYFLQILILILFLLTTACTSSSSSVRYGKVESPKESKQNSVRFTSLENEEEYDLDEFDEKPPVVKPELKNKLKEEINRYSDFTPQITEREKLLFEIIKYIDTPYKYGGIDYNGIDCSAFTQNVFSNSAEIDLPRTANQQFKIGDKIQNENELKFGDLVFFNTTKRSYPGHVGIYVGENLFAHASRTLGVTISSLSEEYYSRRFVGARRIK